MMREGGAVEMHPSDDGSGDIAVVDDDSDDCSCCSLHSDQKIKWHHVVVVHLMS